MIERLETEGWDQVQMFADQCYEDNQQTGSYLSTASVARDMLAIVHGLDQGELLNFWGASWGSMLAQTFAAMFPNNVGRIFMESIMDPYDYISGLWTRNMLDFSRCFDNFLKECLDAPELCQLANLTDDTTADSIKEALAEVLDELYESQEIAKTGLSALGPAVDGTNATIYETLKRTIFQRLYYVSNFPGVDDMMYQVIQRNFSLFQQPPAVETNQAIDPKPAFLEQSVHAWFGISCLDGVLRANSSREIAPYAAAQQATGAFADSYMPQTCACPAWRFEPAERFMGPFSAKTRSPLLFANGLADPITPMVFAQEAVVRFEGSALLTHGGHGHGVEKQPSKCTDQVIRAYFLNGSLPEEGMFCKPDTPAFQWAYELMSRNAEESGKDLL